MKLIAISLMFVLLNGCVYIANKAPGTSLNTPPTQMDTAKIDYDVIGDVQGEATIYRILGIPTNLFLSHDTPGIMVSDMDVVIQLENGNVKSRPSGLFSWLSRLYFRKQFTAVEREALYDALQKNPNTDGLIAVRTVNYEKRNFMIYQYYTASVKARAIKIRQNDR